MTESDAPTAAHPAPPPGQPAPASADPAAMPAAATDSPPAAPGEVPGHVHPAATPGEAAVRPPESTGRAHPPPPPRSGNEALAWLGAIGFLLLAAAIGFVAWSSARHAAQPSAALQTLQARVAELEQRPSTAAAPPAAAQTAGTVAAADLAALAARVTALEHRPAADLAPLEARVAALEHRAPPDLAPLQQRVATLEKRAADDAQLAARVDALAARIDALAGRDEAALAALGRRQDADETRTKALEQAGAALTAKAEQATRLARIEQAMAALAAGRALGELPGAPPAVARFAIASPPTEAALRIGFAQAEHAALAVAQPDVAGQALFGRMLTRAEDLITVRQGDRVLLGNPAAGVLARARTALEVGDLAGATAAVGSLSGPPAQAMADWLAQAKAVLAARAGLAEMAAHA